MLCVGVDAVNKRVNCLFRLHYRKKKKRQQFLLSGGVSFLFSNLYINCNVRSYQYSTFVSVFHL